MFLTAYDPSDLPGGSVDPMGFDRGYTFLADCILPGMTNVASRPRYLSVLCSGIFLANVDPDASPRKQRERRLECALRFERLWGMANALASRQTDLSPSGIRGITYVHDEMDRLERKGASAASAKYKLLARQQQYGVFGMYGAIAEGMRFLDRRGLILTPDGGARLAEAFIDETELPYSVHKAVQSDKDDFEVSLDTLTKWGGSAHVETTPKNGEARFIREAFFRDPIRSRMAGVLVDHPWRESDGSDDETELRRLARIVTKLDSQGEHKDLRAAMLAIVAYENCYRLSMLAFERILWLCRAGVSGALTQDSLQQDEVLKQAANAADETVKALTSALEEMREAKLALGFERIEDVHHFLLQAASVANDVAMFCQTVLSRHADVQHGKFDRGRRKMPWVEEGSQGISLTMTRAGGRDAEVTRPDQIRPHFYRLGSAEMFLRQGGIS